MYFRESESVGAYHESSSLQGPGLGLLPAIAVGGGIAAAIIAALEALAFVVSAIAAAYLLIKAYEKAKAMGLGVGWAGQQLANAMARVVTAANRIIAEIQRLLNALARQPRRPPECESLIRLMQERLARIQEAVRRYIAEPTNIRDPQSPAKIQLLRELGDSMERIGPMIQLLRTCLRV